MREGSSSRREKPEEAKFPGGLAEPADKTPVRTPTTNPLPLTRSAGAPVVPPARQSHPDYAQVTVNVHNNIRNAEVIRLFQGNSNGAPGWGNY